MLSFDGWAGIWDMDGTLVDTAELHFDAWTRLLRELGQPFSRDDFAATFGKRNPEIIHQLFGNRYSEAEIAKLGDRKEVYYRSAAEKGVELLPGARALLQGLHDAGLRQALASSAPLANLQLIVRQTNVQQYFQAMVSMEDTQRGKPDPQVFQLAAERLAVPAGRCLVFEDAVAGVQAAKAAGMKCVAVAFVGHHSDEKLKEAGADLVVKSLEEVTADRVLKLVR